jgi:hypothetical protein
MQLPVTMRVTYPTGRTFVYTGFTTLQGIWTKTFPVPEDAATRRGGLAQVLITVKRNFTATTSLHFLLIG